MTHGEQIAEKIRQLTEKILESEREGHPTDYLYMQLEKAIDGYTNYKTNITSTTKNER